MSKSHLKTAQEYGMKQALEQAGYRSIEEVQKEAAALGLLNQPKTASADPIAALFANIGK